MNGTNINPPFPPHLTSMDRNATGGKGGSVYLNLPAGVGGWGNMDGYKDGPDVQQRRAP